MATMIFDLETVPDLISAKKLLNLPELSDSEILSALLARQRKQSNGSEFLPHHLQQVVAISILLHQDGQLKIWTLDSSEENILTRFFQGIAKYQPTIVTWNGNGFDLPVLHYRALLYGIQAAHYWEVGENNTNYKWNNYINRYHYRHLDLMDVLSSYQLRAAASLDDIAVMLGAPGKMGLKGDLVSDWFFSGEIAKISDYCEIDVLNTYLVYLKFELMRGKLNCDKIAAEYKLLQEYLQQQDKQHFNEFLQHWEFS